jgi:hypothetical protein
MIKLPRTLHIQGSRMPAGKSDPEAIQFAKLRGEPLTVEEKVDGTGVGICFENHALSIYHRGTKLETFSGKNKEFFHLHNWCIHNLDDLGWMLRDRYVMFGEWMFLKHHIFYDRLPHWFLESDIYDQQEQIWLSTKARDELIGEYNHIGIRQVPVIATVRPTKLKQLTDLIKRSQYQSEHWPAMMWKFCEQQDIELDKALHHTDKSGLMEGLYIKHEDDKQVLGRYKYVRYEFVNEIVNEGVHWKMQKPVENLLVNGWDYNPRLT